MRLVEGRRYAELEHSARKVLGRNGRHSLALRALTFALVGLGRYEDVVAEADRALRLAPGDGEVHNNRAIALSMLMRWDEAIADFHEALRRAPEDPEIHMNLGSAYVRMCRWDDAVPALLKAIGCGRMFRYASEIDIDGERRALVLLQGDDGTASLRGATAPGGSAGDAVALATYRAAAALLAGDQP